VSSHDDDNLDFDFFDDDATRETPGAGRSDAPPRTSGDDGGGGGGPRRPHFQAPHGVTPILRLIGFVAFAILIVVLLVLWAQGCSGDKKHDEYSNAMTELGQVGSNSAKIGSNLAELLTTPGLKQAELETSLQGLIDQQQQDVDNASNIDVPGPLRPSTDHAVEALGLRVSGMQGLLETFKETKDDDSKDATTAGEKLAEKARLLDASDVVWQVLFRDPAQATMQDEGVGDVTAPASVFVENVELYTARSMTAIWLRVHGASTGGTPSGVHGTGLEAVVVQPAGTTLSTDTETTIKASTDLKFDVSVKNTGDNQEVRIEVTLTIPKGTTPIVKKQTIDILDIGEIKTVTFQDFPDPPFGEKTSVQVSVKPVAGEARTDNNSAEYPVIFSLE
jgi:CARDB